MYKLKILILDDSEIVLNMASLALSDAGYEVFTASSLPEFDKILEEQSPDLILTDIKMPEISGDNVCRVLKAKFDTHMIPIVLFSTLGEEELSQLAERSGADGYVCKSQGMEEIVKRVQELTEEIVF
jgi:DNA-binding response OmpR family regulator